MGWAFQLPIVIVDDSRISLTVAEKMVHNAGFFNTKKVGLKDAFDLVSENSPCLVLTDLLMPTIKEGKGLIEKLRTKFPRNEVPILVMSSSRYQEHVRDVIALGANDYLIKPLQAEALNPRLWSLASDVENRVDATFIQLKKDKKLTAPQVQACQSFFKLFHAGHIPILALGYWLQKIELNKLLAYLERHSPNDDYVQDHLEDLGWTEETWVEVESYRKAASTDLPMLLQTVFGIDSKPES